METLKTWLGAAVLGIVLLIIGWFGGYWLGVLVVDKLAEHFDNLKIYGALLLLTAWFTVTVAVRFWMLGDN